MIALPAYKPLTALPPVGVCADAVKVSMPVIVTTGEGRGYTEATSERMAGEQLPPAHMEAS